MEQTWNEERLLEVNDPRRIHDPAIFSEWNYYSELKNKGYGKCSTCEHPLTQESANHIDKRFYCNARHEAKQRWQMAHAPRLPIQQAAP